MAYCLPETLLVTNIILQSVALLKTLRPGDYHVTVVSPAK